MYSLHPITESGRPWPGEAVMDSVKAWSTKFLTRLLLFAYALFVLKPVLPVLMDELAHTFWKNVHIAVVHTVNGKEHVHYELARAGKDLDKQKSGGKTKSATDTSSYVVAEPLNDLRPVADDYIPEQYQLYSNGLPESFQELNYPPPKC